MTALDLWAALTAFVAGSAIAIRARMLRPHQQAWTEAPAAVWASLAVLALGLVMSAITLWFGGHASPREATIYTLLAAVSLIMLWNLNRSGRAKDVARREFAEQARMAIEASGPPARYPHERSPKGLR